MADGEDFNTPKLLTSGDENEDRRWVMRALLALVLITGFFISVGRFEGTSSTTGQSSSVPATPGPSAGSTSLPKGPGQ